MTRVHKRSFWTFILTYLLVSVPAWSQDAVDRYHPVVTVGGKLGSHRDMADTEVLVPLRQDGDRLVYGNLRWKQDRGDGWEGNVGVGYRTITPEDVLFGGFVMGDLRETPAENHMRQVTLGAEALTDKYEFRVNAYIPERGKKLASSTSRALQVGSQIFVEGTQTFEQAAPGFDVEVGYRLPYEPLDLRLYVAGYHFFQPSYTDMTGVRARLRAQTQEFDVAGQPMKIQLEGEAQQDNIRKDTYFAGARVSFPLGRDVDAPQLTRLQSRMMEHPVRDVDIVVANQATVQQEAAKAQVGGQSYNSVYVMDADVEADLAAAVDDLPEESLILLKTGVTSQLDQTITLKSGQSIQSADSALQVSGAGGSAVLDKQSNVQAHLVKATSLGAANPLIVLPNGGNVTLRDLKLTNEDGSTGDGNVMISNLNQPVGTIILDNVRSEGAVIVDVPSGHADVLVQNSYIAGGVFRTRNAAEMDLSLKNNEFRRSHTTAMIVNQAITSNVLVESINTSKMHVREVTNNVLRDEKAKIGGRPAIGMGFTNSSSVDMQVDKVADNEISRDSGLWDSGAILGQATGGHLIHFDEVHGNAGEVFESVNIRVNIGQDGATADTAGMEAANNGMTFAQYGNVVITNNP